MPLNERRQRFVAEYLIDLNGTQAAIRAGYSPRTANEQAARLLADASVRAAVDEQMAERAERTKVTQDRVLQELARIGFADLRDAASWTSAGMELIASGELAVDTSAAIKEVKVVRTITRGKDDYEQERVEQRVAMHDKRAALETIGKHLGMFTERVHHEGNVGVTVVRHTPALDEE